MNLQTERIQIAIERTAVEATSDLPQLDPTWRFTDAAGHPHAGDDLASTSVAKYEPCDCDIDTGPHDVFAGRFCRECGEELHPRTIIDPFRKFVPGRQSLTVSVDGLWWQVMGAEDSEAIMEMVRGGASGFDEDRVAEIAQRGYPLH